MKFYAQVYGPQNGYAYAFSTEDSIEARRWTWDLAPDDLWDTVLVDREDIGERIGQRLIDGSRCDVFKAQEGAP